MEHDTPLDKVCKDCGKSFPATAEFFYIIRGRPHPYCKPCHGVRNRKWHKDHPEKMREASRNYALRNVEKERERHRRQYAANPEKRRAAVAKSYRKHGDKRRAERKEYAQKNREAEAAYNKAWAASVDPIVRKERAALCRARKKGVFIEFVSYEAIYERDGGCCYRCKKELDRREAVFDHIKPMAAGGIHSSLNIKLSCYNCNRRKGTTLDLRWIRYLKPA